MGCGDSKSTSGQNPQQTNQQQQPNKFDRLSEMDSQSTQNDSSSTALYGGHAAAKWKKALADKRARDRAGKQDSMNTTDHKDNRNTKKKGKKNQIREPINEKGFRRKIREALRQAATGSDIEELEHAIYIFEKNRLEDHGDLEDAEERLKFLCLRKEIRDAILRRHVETLNKGITHVEESQYRSELMHYLENAKKLRQHLQELQHSHDVLAMEQETLSEVKGYTHPPPGVKEVMTATYLILDYPESKLTEWSDVQILLNRFGNENLLKECLNYDTVNLNEHTCKRVEQLQKDFTLNDIKRVSNGAAAFYLWNQKMTGKYSKDKKRSSASEQPAANRKKNKG